MTVLVALLRAVNVGGTGRLEMKALRAACEAEGFGRVATYIQSGNIVFESALPASAAKATLDALLRDELGLKSLAVVRTAAQLEAAIAANPFQDAAAERPSRLLLGFPERRPAAGARDALAAHRGPERIELARDLLYIDYVGGAARSKLTPAFIERALGTPSTARNWSTVGRLAAMARAMI
jgi:uncharacterized protein (DUF1697 family)